MVVVEAEAFAEVLHKGVGVDLVVAVNGKRGWEERGGRGQRVLLGGPQGGGVGDGSVFLILAVP